MKSTRQYRRVATRARLSPIAALALTGATAALALAQPCAEWNVYFPGLQPNARSGHTMTFDPVHNVVLLYGGVGPSSFGDTWAWGGGNWFGLSASGPPARAGQRMAFDTARGRAVLVGNSSSAFVSETWEFDGMSWTQFGGSTPPPRFEHAVAFDSVRNKLVLFGGQQQGEEGNFAVGDTWEYDGSSWTQQFPTNSPSPRHKHAMAFDSHRGRTVLYGGFDSFTFSQSGETWEWDGSDWTLAASSGAPATNTHALVYDSNSQRTILIPGGAPTNDPVVRTWS